MQKKKKVILLYTYEYIVAKINRKIEMSCQL
jgi:hypothetical protein